MADSGGTVDHVVGADVTVAAATPSRLSALRSTLGTALRRSLPYAPVGFALLAGLNEFRLVRFDRLAPDVINYMLLAERFDLHSLAGGAREPVWPAVLAIPVFVLGPFPEIARLLGVLGFGFMVLTMQLLVGRRYGPGWSFVAGLVLAASPWLIFQAARGLREETAAGLLTLFAYVIVAGPMTGRRAVALGALAGITGMLRWDTVLVSLPTLFLAMLVARSGVRQWAGASFVLAVIVAPLLVGNLVTEGDPFYHSNVHARFFTNVEFHDQPGFPTSRELATNGFAGPRTTWATYLFRLHTPRQLFDRTVNGFEDIPLKNATYLFFYPDGLSFDRFPTLRILRSPQSIVAWGMAILALIGAVSLARGPAWPVALMLPLSIGVYAVISSLIDFRLAMNVIPLMVVADVEALVVLAPRLSSRVDAAIGSRLAPER